MSTQPETRTITDVGRTLPTPNRQWLNRYARVTYKGPPQYLPASREPQTTVWLCIATQDVEEPYRWVQCPGLH